MTPGVLAPRTCRGWSWPGPHVSPSLSGLYRTSGCPLSPRLPCAELKQRPALTWALAVGTAGPHWGPTCLLGGGGTDVHFFEEAGEATCLGSLSPAVGQLEFDPVRPPP